MPDRLVFDLDPPDEDPASHFPVIRAGALALGVVLRELGLEPFAMTSGSRGIHVVAPLRRRAHADEVRATAGELAERLAERRPDELTTFWRKEKRGGRVLVDVARNTYAQTTVAPYAVRALPGAPVATPLAWEELDDPELHPRRWTLATVPGRVAERGDPWAGIAGAAAGAPASLDPRQPLGQLAQRPAVVRVERLAVGPRRARPVEVAARDAVQRGVGDEPPGGVDPVLERRDRRDPDVGDHLRRHERRRVQRGRRDLRRDRAPRPGRTRA